MEHTPGPWYTELVTKTATGLQETTILARNDSHWPSGGRTIAEVGHWRDRVDPEADALLIAAAPGMKRALVIIAGAWDEELAEIARVALKAVKGE